MKNVKSFYLQKPLKNVNFFLISLTCLPQLHSLRKFSRLFCGHFLQGCVKVVTVVILKNSNNIFDFTGNGWKTIFRNTVPFSFVSTPVLFIYRFYYPFYLLTGNTENMSKHLNLAKHYKMINCNGIRNHNHSVRKQTFNHLIKLTKSVDSL